MGIGKNKCDHCDLPRTKEGHDGCLGSLPGVMNACCGHGEFGSGTYVQLLDGTSISGDDGKKVIEILKKYRKGDASNIAK